MSITVEMLAVPTCQRSEQGGIDLGINRLATLSDGGWFENQKPLRNLLKKLKHASVT